MTEERLTFDDAESLCLFRYDTHLASIHNDIDLLNAKNAWTGYEYDAWIGLRYNVTKHVWEWTDDTDWDYGTDISGDDGDGPWSDGQPSFSGHDCAEIYNYGDWYDWDCSYEYRSLCAYPKPLKLRTDSVGLQTALLSYIGIIDILDEIYIEFDIIFKSVPSNGSGSTLHFGNNNDEHYPTIIIDTNTNSLQTIISILPNNNFSLTTNISLNSSYHFTFHLTQNYFETTLHSGSNHIIHKQVAVKSHPILMGRNISIHNPCNSNLDVTNLSVSTSNQYDTNTSNEFNYICDESRWELLSGYWDFSSCIVTQNDYNTDTDFFALIGGADASSNNWTDYKLETKFMINDKQNLDTVAWRGFGLMLRSQIMHNELRGYVIGLYWQYTADFNELRMYTNINQPFGNWSLLHSHAVSEVTFDLEYALRIEARNNAFDIYWDNTFIDTWDDPDSQRTHGSVGLFSRKSPVTFTSLRITFEANGDLFTFAPTTAPTNDPTLSPTNPTVSPTTNSPTYTPTSSPTNMPTNYPSNIPTNSPIASPPTTRSPTNNPISSQAKPTTSSEEGQAIQTTFDMEQNNGNDARSDTLILLFIIFITFAAIIVVGCILFFIYRNKGRPMSVANERHIGIELKSMSTPRDDMVMLVITPTAGAVMQNDGDIVANIMGKKNEIVLEVSSDDDNALYISSDGGMTTAGFVDKNAEDRDVDEICFDKDKEVQCAHELMVSGIEERYKIEMEEEGDNMDDSFVDVKSEYLQEGKNGLNENKTSTVQRL